MVLGAQSPMDNVIHRGNISIVVDTVDFSQGQGRIISYLYMDFGLLNFDVNVSCRDEHLQMKMFKLLGKFFC